MSWIFFHLQIVPHAAVKLSYNRRRKNGIAWKIVILVSVLCRWQRINSKTWVGFLCPVPSQPCLRSVFCLSHGMGCVVSPQALSKPRMWRGGWKKASEQFSYHYFILFCSHALDESVKRSDWRRQVPVPDGQNSRGKVWHGSHVPVAISSWRVFFFTVFFCFSLLNLFCQSNSRK